MYAIAWLFVSAVAAVDIGFALAYSETMELWELNPFALALVETGGVELACWYRAASVLFAIIVLPVGTARARLWLTGAALTSHAWLASLYLYFLLA
jgi:hypothetical protein